jgi:serine/threonine-protein kinase ULK/ATG1
LVFCRYDAKADLWSVGTVLFEMIAGRPPFNGENHIDLLRNIQRKAVRLPPDVRVSKACVNLLRLLLNRNPLSRAGFKEFFEACDTFVALGCEGLATDDNGTCRMPKSNDLGTIPENDGSSGSPTTSSDSIVTVQTTAQNEQQQKGTQQHPLQANPGTSPSMQQQEYPGGANIVSPRLTAATTPSSATMISNANLYETRPYNALTQRSRFQPLTSSPPSSGPYISQHSNIPVQVPSLAPGMPQPGQNWNQNQQPGSSSVSQSQTSNDDSGFVMVEHSLGSSRNDPYDTSSAMTSRRNSQNATPQYYINASPPNLSARNDYGNPSAGIPMEERVKISKGMLSTSPGTGKLLLGMVSRAALGFGGGGGGSGNSSNNAAQEQAMLGDELAAAAKMIATAEDVGRRAVSVAHLGDTRAYLGMRLIFKSNEEGSSLLSSAPMEGVEEEPIGNEDRQNISADSASTEMIVPLRRRSSTLSDKHMAEAIAEEEEEDTEEMPFAISPEAPSVTLPSRSNVSVYNRSTNMSSMRKSATKADPQTIRGHFGEALSCYLKALKMLKGAVGAAQRVSSDLESLQTQIGRSPTDYDVSKMKKRCEVTANWLCTQFNGVLERADAASVEIAKLTMPSNEDAKEEQSAPTVTSVEELIYNHALTSGRDGAVKHLLGQYDAARSSYRSAGLLAETLLMEANIGADDRRILEGYVDGFAARITELDQLMLQQSKMAGSSNNASSRRGSGVVGLIGPPPSAPTGFLVGTPTSR